LKNHAKFSNKDLRFQDTEGKKFYPFVIEPSVGIERIALALLSEAYHEEKNKKEKRIVLSLHPKIAPLKIAVFPLLPNKPELVKVAKEIYNDLRKFFNVAWDDRGNIGKRYYSQDEAGTPMKQERIAIDKLKEFFQTKLNKA